MSQLPGVPAAVARSCLGEQVRRGRTVGVRVTEAAAEELREREQGKIPDAGNQQRPASCGGLGSGWARRSTNVSSSVADRNEFWWNERKPDDRVLWETNI